MLALKFKIPFWKDTIYLNGTEMFSLEKLFFKDTCRYSVNILRDVLQKLKGAHAEVLRGVIKKYWKMTSKKYCEVFCKTTEISFTKNTKRCSETIEKFSLKILICRSILKILKSVPQNILRNILQKYWKGV